MTLQGVIAAVPTPIGDDGKPRKEMFLAHCRHLLENGCDGLNVLGSTGEATSFSGAARREVMAWAAQNLPRERMMVGTGSPSLAEAVAMTEAADDLGFPVALVLPPWYYKPLSDDGLFAFYAALDKALGARAIEVWFYDYPQLTGIRIPPAVIARLRALNPARFGGIKDSSGDLEHCDAVLAAAPGIAVFPSSETSLEGGRARGFAGCISATANLTSALCQRLWQGDTAVAPEVGRLRREIAARPLIPAVKHLVGRLHGDDGWRRVLPPFLPLDAAVAAGLESEVPA